MVGSLSWEESGSTFWDANPIIQSGLWEFGALATSLATSTSGTGSSRWVIVTPVAVFGMDRYIVQGV